MQSSARTAQSYIRAARPSAHGMIALPLLWGQALALLLTGQFSASMLIVILCFGVFFQIYILYLNDFADEDIDRNNHTFWLSGGSRVIPDALLSGQSLFVGALIAMVILALISVGSGLMGRPWMFLLGALALFVGWTYSLRPIRSSYSGFGEMHQALSCGALLPLTAYYLQLGSLEALVWPLLIPGCLIFFAGNIITALLDSPSDRDGGKRTYAVRHGERRARRDAVLILGSAYVAVAVLSGPWMSGPWPSVLVSGPALALLIYVVSSGLLSDADVANRSACKRFVLISTLSQAWVLTTWTGLFFWQGFDSGSLQA